MRDVLLIMFSWQDIRPQFPNYTGIGCRHDNYWDKEQGYGDKGVVDLFGRMTHDA
jgi:hypothetical protein